MYPLDVTLFIIAAITLIASMVIFVVAIKLYYKAVENKKAANKYVENIKTKVAQKYNAYVSISNIELDQWLAKIFARQIELAVDLAISGSDPDKKTKLYAYALDGTLTYIGKESISAIDYHYGDGYVIRWVETIYRLLEKHGNLNAIIETNIKSVDIEKMINSK